MSDHANTLNILEQKITAVKSFILMVPGEWRRRNEKVLQFNQLFSPLSLNKLACLTGQTRAKVSKHCQIQKSSAIYRHSMDKLTPSLEK
jgi:hypothetical protein